MLVIRLTRIGKKNQPYFRVVLAEKREAVKGKFIEILGNYDPRLKTKALKAERIKYWLSQGAQASPTVHNMLVSEKIISGPKVKAWRPKKKKSEVAKPASEQPVAAAKTKTEIPAEEKPAETTESVPAIEAPAEEPKTEERGA
jgi:small subunit ribosomal protein S16